MVNAGATRGSTNNAGQLGPTNQVGNAGNTVNTGVAFGGQPTPQQIDAAAQSWQADTEIVSQFLSTAESLTGQQLEQAASRALSAENDELNHRVVLDRMFRTGSTQRKLASVEQASNVLDTQGTFQFVVDALQNLTNTGSQMSSAQVGALVRAINEDRCSLVLPSIDRYLAAAATAGQQKGSVGAALRAIRPVQCGGPGQGGNGNGQSEQTGGGQTGSGQIGGGQTVDGQGPSAQNGQLPSNGLDEAGQDGQRGQNEQPAQGQNGQATVGGQGQGGRENLGGQTQNGRQENLQSNSPQNGPVGSQKGQIGQESQVRQGGQTSQSGQVSQVGNGND
ncbi:hypothetical protein E4U54_000243 [Claviceps lovelessii]|nr:hypothetical protein E4U54_000243 [Claviceps lovelessii]